MARHIGIAVAALAVACATPHREDAAPYAVSMPAPSAGPQSTGWQLPVSAHLSERNRCIDRELKARKLNEFGDPEGVAYAEGRPFGVTETTDRYVYVMRHRPDIATSCTRAPTEPDR